MKARQLTARQLAIAQLEADKKTELILRGLRRFATLAITSAGGRWSEAEWAEAEAAEQWITERERFMEKKS